MSRRRTPRLWQDRLVYILAVVVALAVTFPALAEYLGPNRTVTTWDWRRLHCSYQAVYDPPGAGWYGCTLDLYDVPDSSCPSTGSVEGYFTPAACSWSASYCQVFGCQISRSGSIESCGEGETGCRATERTVTHPEAAVSGSVSCAAPGGGGWCLSGGELALAGSEPLTGYTILALEGTRNSAAFACSGAACSVPFLEGSNDFNFWAISSWGDTSRMGSAGGNLDTQPPVISGQMTGTAGDGGWYVSEVTVDVTASDPAPGSGLGGLETSLDGGGWTSYGGPIPLSDGLHTLDMRAVDLAGNAGSETRSIRVDAQAPEVNLSAAASFCPGCGERLDIAVDVQDAGSGIVEWALSVDAGLVAGGSEAISRTVSWDGCGLSGGPHTLRLGARDAAGNTSEGSLAVNLIDPTPVPPSPKPPPEAPLPRLAPILPTAAPSTTPTAVPTAPPSRPTRTAEAIRFGGAPAAPRGDEGEGARSTPLVEVPDSPPASVPGSSRGVLWGAAALALIGSATALALDQARRRREAEARRREEMQRRNAEAGAREAAERARIAAAALAAVAAAAAEATRREAEQRRLERKEGLLEQPPPAPKTESSEESSKRPEGISPPASTTSGMTLATATRTPTPPTAYSTPTPSLGPTRTHLYKPKTATATSSPTPAPISTSTPAPPSATPTLYQLQATNTPDPHGPLIEFEQAPEKAIQAGEEFLDSFNMLPDQPPALWPLDRLSPLNTVPEVAPYLPAVRWALRLVATAKHIFKHVLDNLGGLPSASPPPHEPVPWPEPGAGSGPPGGPGEVPHEE